MIHANDYPPAIINSEIYEFLRSSKYTPSVSHSLDSSLREGAGNAIVRPDAIQRAARKPQRCGRFSSPLRKLRNRFLLPFNGRHSLSLAFARQLPQRGSRGNVPHNVNHPPAGCFVSGRVIFWVLYGGYVLPFNRVLAKVPGFGRFSSPLRSSDFLRFTIHRRTLPQSRFARQLPQRGSRGMAGAIHRGTR